VDPKRAETRYAACVGAIRIQRVVTDSTALCLKCLQNKPHAEFYKDQRRRDGMQAWCKTCQAGYNRVYSRTTERGKRRYGALTPAQRRTRKVKFEYGVDPDTYDRMLSEQGGVCALCKKPETMKNRKNLCVDHDHQTGKVRGLLCQRCNQGLGWLGDTVEGLEAAIEYVRSRA
jgi:Recombination endonuclease VII